jgi:hypothetical protein
MGIHRFIRRFSNKPAGMTIAVQIGFQKDHARAVYMEQRERLMVLKGRLTDETEETACSKALAEALAFISRPAEIRKSFHGFG